MTRRLHHWLLIFSMVCSIPTLIFAQQPSNTDTINEEAKALLGQGLDYSNALSNQERINLLYQADSLFRHIENWGYVIYTINENVRLLQQERDSGSRDTP